LLSAQIGLRGGKHFEFLTRRAGTKKDIVEAVMPLSG